MEVVAVGPVLDIEAADEAPKEMRVKKRDGTLTPVDVNKIVNVVQKCGRGLGGVDPMRVAVRTVAGLYDGATTQELDRLSIEVAASACFEEPQYSRLAARLLARYITEEVRVQGVDCFSKSIVLGRELGLINDRVGAFVADHHAALDEAIATQNDSLFEYFGIRTLYDRYLLKHPTTRDVVETPQHFFMRVAVGVSDNIDDTLELYSMFSSLSYLPSSPTLFNSSTMREQLSSCFLLDSPDDDLQAIYQKYLDIALLSKFAGGIGVGFSRVRSQGSLIKGTNGESNGVVPFLKTLDASVAAVNQGGKRKGAACVYLEPWHADIEAFLELRDNTGDEARRTHNLNLANWIPDEFMRRVQADEPWSLFDPKAVPELVDIYGAEFDAVYKKAEAEERFEKQMSARDLYSRMMRTLAQTGNGWMCFKDASNAKSNQTAVAENRIHLSNLCTEILEVNSNDETAVCNLGSINLSRHLNDEGFDFERLAETVRVSIRQLDRVIDRNLYVIDTAKSSNSKWRPVGLGMMGLQDVFFKLRMDFDSHEAKILTARIGEEIYYNALRTSVDLAKEHGAHPGFAETRAAKGVFQFELWGREVEDGARWDTLRDDMVKYGLRNSLMIAIAPTATIASIAGCFECVEPQVSNLFKRETLSGEFLQVNRYLVAELKQLGLWTESVRQKIKSAEGSIQKIKEIPEALKNRFRTAWELPQKALIDLAVARGPFIDQSQSLNLFMESPTIGKLSSMYMYAWQEGLKTTYYLRSRPATRIAQTSSPSATAQNTFVSPEQLACSLENPESCEACQ